MKKISYYLVVIVVAGVALVSLWTYQKYFKEWEVPPLLFVVEKGDIQETVKVRGEVVSQKEFDLEFPFSGTVEKVFVQEGQQVRNGNPLVKLETIDFELEIKKIQAQLAQAEATLAVQEAKLAELERGARVEEIQVQKVRVNNARVSLGDAKKNLVDKLQDAYTKSDDAVKNKVDQFISNPKGSNPQIDFSIADSEMEKDIEWDRISVETILNLWKQSLAEISLNENLNSQTGIAKQNLDTIKSFLDITATAVNSASADMNFTQATLDGYKDDVSAGRTNINTAIAGLTSAEEKLRTAESRLKLEEQELILKKAGTTKELLTAQEAQVRQAKASTQTYLAQIDIIKEKIRKSILYAPGDVKVMKVWPEKGEVFSPGQIAISLATFGHKIQADISELEIGRIKSKNGNPVVIKFDAFPGFELSGKIVSIEPKEIIKDGDKYYRVNVFMEKHDLGIRSGMNADLTISVSFKKDVLKIPELAIYKKNGKSFVTIFKDAEKTEIEIKTGISDGENIEIISGLKKGQTVAVPVD